MTKDFNLIRDCIDRLEKLGVPTVTILQLEEWLADELVKDKITNCDHRWIDATSEYVKGTAYCSKCGGLEHLENVTITPSI